MRSGKGDCGWMLDVQLQALDKYLTNANTNRHFERKIHKSNHFYNFLFTLNILLFGLFNVFLEVINSDAH